MTKTEWSKRYSRGRSLIRAGLNAVTVTAILSHNISLEETLLLHTLFKAVEIKL